MLIKIIIGTLLLFTGFVCGGTIATKIYSERLSVMGRYVDSAMADSSHMSDLLLACRTTLDMGGNRER